MQAVAAGWGQRNDAPHTTPSAFQRETGGVYRRGTACRAPTVDNLRRFLNDPGSTVGAQRRCAPYQVMPSPTRVRGHRASGVGAAPLRPYQVRPGHPAQALK